MDTANNATACYQALKARDARFDGRFFVGVSSPNLKIAVFSTMPPWPRVRVTALACAAVQS
jgi:hypothetical protein